MVKEMLTWTMLIAKGCTMNPITKDMVKNVLDRIKTADGRLKVKPVRIAILDTGINEDHEAIRHHIFKEV